MKKYVLFAITLVFATGCASGVKKSFTIMADPPDVRIKVVSGKNLKTQSFRSSDRITVRVPEERRLQAKTYVEVSKDTYKPKKISLRSIKNGQVLNVKLEKEFQYHLKCRLLSPRKTQSLEFRDKAISVSFDIGEQAFQMNLTNQSPYTLKILWNSAEYTDVFNRQRRLMHSGVRYQDRNNPIPVQKIPPYGSVEQAIVPINSVVYDRAKKQYDLKQLFPLDSSDAVALKGRAFYLFIPMEIDRQIIPYNFKVHIADVVKQ